jgi:hypothetical protein
VASSTASIPRDATRGGESRSRVRGLLSDEAFLIMILSVWAFAVLRFLPQEIVQDSWTNLAAGREIAQHGLPRTETLTIWASGDRWTDQQWLAQLTFYGAFVLGGLKAALLTHATAVIGAFVLGAVFARRLGASTQSVALTVGICMFVAPWGAQMRAQSLALPFFVAVYGLLASDSRRPSRKVFVALPLIIVWGNLHGSAALGALLVAGYGAFLLVKRERVLRALCLVAAPLCLLVSPYGPDLPAYYKLMLVNPPFAKYVDEWQATTLRPTTLPFFAAVFAVFVLVARSGRALSPFERIALPALGLMGFLASRNIVWFSLALLVSLPLLLDAAGLVRFNKSQRYVRTNRLLAVAAIAVVFVLAANVLTRSDMSFEEDWSARGADVVSSEVARNPALRVFPDSRTADWVLWKEPKLAGRVAYDVRFELNTEPELNHLSAFFGRTADTWRRAADGYALFVFENTPERASLTRSLLADPGISLVFKDRSVLILRRE